MPVPKFPESQKGLSAETIHYRVNPISYFQSSTGSHDCKARMRHTWDICLFVLLMLHFEATEKKMR